MPKENAEQRSSVRFPVHAPVVFSWTDRQGRRRGTGFTRDICASGAYVMTDDVPPLGDRIEVDALLPTMSGQAEGVRLRAEGHVVRVGAASEPNGFAVTADFGRHA